MLAEQFRLIFRDEHRGILKTLLDLMRTFEARDLPRIRSLLHQAAVYTGPHFRYEEESLYPSLVPLFGEKYIEFLLSAHDGAIGTARRLVELAQQETLSDEDVRHAKELIQGVLPHVSDCDGLSIMVEQLPKEEVQAILDTRERSNGENVDLLSWAEKIRKRPAQVVV